MCSVRPTRLVLFCCFKNVNWLPTFKNQEIPYKNADFKPFFKNLNTWQHWVDTPPSTARGCTGAVLPLLLQLFLRLKAPCTPRRTCILTCLGSEPNAAGSRLIRYLDGAPGRDCGSPKRKASKASAETQCAVGRGDGQLSSSTSHGRTRSNGCQSEKADLESKQGKAFQQPPAPILRPASPCYHTG